MMHLGEHWKNKYLFSLIWEIVSYHLHNMLNVIIEFVDKSLVQPLRREVQLKIMNNNNLTHISK